MDAGQGGPVALAAALTHAQLLPTDLLASQSLPPESPRSDTRAFSRRPDRVSASRSAQLHAAARILRPVARQLSRHTSVHWARCAAVLAHHCAPLRALRQKLHTRLVALDLVHDLAEDIGSARWFRGLGTMLGLAGLALSFWPDFSALEAAPAMLASDVQKDEFRSLTLQPLALGGDVGRRMGATAAVSSLASAPERPTVQLVTTLVQGDSFGRMLQRVGVGAGDAARVAAMVSAAVPLDEIGPGTRFDITLGRRDPQGGPRPLERMDFRARFDLGLAVARQGNGLILARRPIAVDATPLRIRGTVGNSLYRSARAAGVPVKAIQQYLQAIDTHLSLDSDIGADDQFDIVIAFKRAASGESEAGEVLYAGLEHAGKPRAELLRWGKDGQFFEASGIGKPRSSIYMPVAGRMTSGFGLRRHPILGYTRMHAGVDFGAAWGAPIYAVSDGTVSYSGRHGGHGNYVRLEHGGGMGSGYAHMSRIAVSSGARVRAGQVIGYVGSSGLSTGPHLHYEVYQSGRTVNPMGMRFTVAAQIDGKELAAFKARLSQMKSVVPGAALARTAPKQAIAQLSSREIGRLSQIRRP